MKKYYFASDVHLGLGNHQQIKTKELLFVNWLKKIEDTTEELFLLGDIFDFWFEYHNVVPQGFTRTIGQLASMCDKGIPIHFFTGNHDLWLDQYLKQETGMHIYTKSLEVNLCGKSFLLAHGDALDHTDTKHLLLRKFFTSKLLRSVFSAIHPRIGIGLAKTWSNSSRAKNKIPVPFRFQDEGLFQFAVQMQTSNPHDYYIFGHRHTPLITPIDPNASLCILGEWIGSNIQYAQFDGASLELIKIN